MSNPLLLWIHHKTKISDKKHLSDWIEMYLRVFKNNLSEVRKKTLKLFWHLVNRSRQKWTTWSYGGNDNIIPNSILDDPTLRDYSSRIIAIFSWLASISIPRSILPKKNHQIVCLCESWKKRRLKGAIKNKFSVAIMSGE